MHVLGVSCYYHDAAAALLKDGKLVAAAEEERFTRKKHDHGFPERAIQFCLETAGIPGAELDYVVFYEKPLLKFERILLNSLTLFPKSYRVFREAMVAWFNEKLWIKSQLQTHLGIPKSRILFVEHHLSHAASALFCSPYSEAAVLTVDGVGEWSTAALGHGFASWNGHGENRIQLDRELRFPHSLGLLYSAFTAYLGFRVNSGEYKVMGMAPYGTPRYVDDVLKVAKVDHEGGVLLNLEYFLFPHSTHQTFSRKFIELFGSPRRPESEFFTIGTHPAQDHPNWDCRIAEENQKYADIAASIQYVTEETLLAMARAAHRQTSSRNLVLAGGVALNSSANGRIVREGPFENVYIQPAAGDAGGALGAALYAYHVLLGKPREFVMEHAYWGSSYSEAEQKQAIQQFGLRWTHFGDEDRLAERVVDSLLDGKVIGWFQGRFEWGPRALGNRSILADPRRQEMKEIVNTKIKFREPFRPFAPAVLEEKAESYFTSPRLEKNYLPRYMLMVTPVSESHWEHIPAVCHQGTGRLQTVRKEWNRLYHKLIDQFGQATGVPVLLNTSFNLRGEPIVNTPQQALETFCSSEIDQLVVGPFLVEKGADFVPTVRSQELLLD